VEFEGEVEQLGDDVLGEVVLGGAQAAGGDDQSGAGERVPDGVGSEKLAARALIVGVF
jgi:hypothetical protein